MRFLNIVFASMLACPVVASAQFSVHYELNEEGPGTAQVLTLKANHPVTLKAAPGESLTAIDLPVSVTNVQVEKRYWYSTQVNWNEQGLPLGYRRAGNWARVSLEKSHRIQLGYDTGTPPVFDTAFWTKTRDTFVARSKKSGWTEVASKCSGPTDAGVASSPRGSYCNVAADAVELRFTEQHHNHTRTYHLTYMLSRGR